MDTTFLQREPLIADTARIFKGAIITGDVTIHDDVGIWHNAVLRGDMARIVIGEGTNVQDGTVIHTNVDMPTLIGKHVTIGHQAIIHAATVEDKALIGMGSIILDGAKIGKEAFVAAGTVVPPGKEVQRRTLVMGNPMRIIKELSDDDIKAMQENTAYYISLLNYHRIQT